MLRGGWFWELCFLILCCGLLCDGDFAIKVDILDGVEEFDTIGHGFLECFSAADETHSACSFVDDGSADGL